MKKLIFIGVLIFICFTQTSFTKASNEKFKPDKEQLYAKNMPYVVYVPISNTFQLGGCSITVTQTLVYIFNNNFILTDIGVLPNWNITVNCGGPPSSFARSASDMTFVISNGEASDVNFATTGIKTLDDVYENSSFKTQYLDYVRSNTPKW